MAAPTLIFEDRGWTVATASWTAAAKRHDEVEIAYLWGADSISWFQSATGVSRVTVTMTMTRFIALIQRNEVFIDLRAFQ